MPELTPTLATAAVNANGVVFDVYGLQGTPDPVEHVPCLILPAPKPIEQCPEEWKDGRAVWIWIDGGPHNSWSEYRWTGEHWCDSRGGESISWYTMYGGKPTHIMLPPPAPQEARMPGKHVPPKARKK